MLWSPLCWGKLGALLACNEVGRGDMGLEMLKSHRDKVIQASKYAWDMYPKPLFNPQEPCMRVGEGDIFVSLGLDKCELILRGKIVH